jgi:hypothetical protein
MDTVADQKRDLQHVLDGLVAAAGGPKTLGRQLLILANGAMVTAAILDSPDAALQAKAAARALLDASL